MNSESDDKQPTLLECSPSELATYLLKSRFQEDIRETISFLMDSAGSLPNAKQSIGEIASQDTEAVDGTEGTQKPSAEINSSKLPDLGLSLLYKAPNSDEESVGPSVEQAVEISVVNPRSKYNLHIQERGLVFRHPKKSSDDFAVHSNGMVHQMVVFPKPESCRLTTATTNKKNSLTGDMILLCLNDNVLIGKKKYSQICFQLPAAFTVEAETDEKDNIDDGGGDDDDDEHKLQGTADRWVAILCESLQIDRVTQPEKVVRVPNPTDPTQTRKKKHDDAFVFSSAQETGKSTTTGGMPFVKCYHGIQDGSLYPLKEGLLFFKPPLFLSRDRIVSISCGRGATSSSGASSRYFDILVEVQDRLDPNSLYSEEFTGISREEYQVVNQFIRRFLVNVSRNDSATASRIEDDTDDDNDNEEEDDVDDDKVESTPGKRNSRRRKASVTAQRINRSQVQNDDDDDDDDEEEYRVSRHDSTEDDSSNDGGDDDDNESELRQESSGDDRNKKRSARDSSDDDNDDNDNNVRGREDSETDSYEMPTKKTRRM